MLGEQAETHDERLLQGSQAILLLTGVDDIKKNRRAGDRARQPILDRGIRRVELGRDGVGGDVLVVGRKRISGKAEGAYPETSTHVDLAI